MAIKQALQCLAQILQNVKAVGHLHCIGGAFRRPIGIRTRTVAADDRDVGMLLNSSKGMPSFADQYGSFWRTVAFTRSQKLRSQLPNLPTDRAELVIDLPEPLLHALPVCD
jgi:hypothetical protein